MVVLVDRLMFENIVFPPTFKFPPIPIPPDTTRAPVVVLVDGRLLPIHILPILVVIPPTYKFPPIPAPPFTMSAPVLVLVV